MRRLVTVACALLMASGLLATPALAEGHVDPSFTMTGSGACYSGQYASPDGINGPRLDPIEPWEPFGMPVQVPTAPWIAGPADFVYQGNNLRITMNDVTVTAQITGYATWATMDFPTVYTEEWVRDPFHDRNINFVCYHSKADQNFDEGWGWDWTRYAYLRVPPGQLRRLQ